MQLTAVPFTVVHWTIVYLIKIDCRAHDYSAPNCNVLYCTEEKRRKRWRRSRRTGERRGREKEGEEETEKEGDEDKEEEV